MTPCQSNPSNPCYMSPVTFGISTNIFLVLIVTARLFVYTFYGQLGTYTIYLVQRIIELLFLADELGSVKICWIEIRIVLTFILVFLK